jgi:hypothetical protein
LKSTGHLVYPAFHLFIKDYRYGCYQPFAFFIIRLVFHKAISFSREKPVDFIRAKVKQDTGRVGSIKNEDNIAVQDKARIAVYDDLLSAPRVVDIQPQGVHEFIEAIASLSYELSHQQGGALPYTVIREITENFIHARFSECTVSILDGGNTLRFADQGPGIAKKNLVLQPGVSSATRAMKDYIRGVGSGFPIVREYLSSSHGYMSIEDNAEDGVVVTISLVVEPVVYETIEHKDSVSNFVTPAPVISPSTASLTLLPKEPVSTGAAFPQMVSTAKQGPIVSGRTDTDEVSSAKQLTNKAVPSRDMLGVQLSKRAERALLILNQQGMLGPVDLADLLDISAPTATRLLQNLESLGMVESTRLKKRILSNAGMAYVQALLMSENSH